MSKNKGSVAVETKGKGAIVASTRTKTAAVLSCFGHKPNTMSGTIDAMLKSGNTLEDISVALQRGFGRDKAHADRKLAAHIAWLRAKRLATITVAERTGIAKGDTWTEGANVAPTRK